MLPRLSECLIEIDASRYRTVTRQQYELANPKQLKAEETLLILAKHSAVNIDQ